MSKLRKPTSNFTMVPNALLRDNSISLKAKGIYALLYSKPDGWTYIEANLIEESNDGRESFRSGMKELAAEGWMTKEQVTDEQGRFSHNDLRLHDRKQKSDDVSTDDGKPVVGEPPSIKTEEVKRIEQDLVPPSGSPQRTKARPDANRRQRLSSHLGETQTCPAEWANEASRLGLSQSDIDREWPNFCDHHNARGNVMSDWLAAWRTWCRNALRFAARDSARSAAKGQAADGGLTAALRASVAAREGARGAGGSEHRSAEGSSEAGPAGGRPRAADGSSDIPF